LFLSDIRPDPEQLPLHENGDDNELEGQTTDEELSLSDSASEESDQNSENSQNETMDREDAEELDSAAGARQSTTELSSANTPSGNTQYDCNGTCSLLLLQIFLKDAALEVTELVPTNQTHFTLDAIPSR